MATNYEKLKNMTVNEMVELFDDWFSCGFCEKILKHSDSFYPSCIDFCKEKRPIKIKQWLLSEVK